MSEHEVGVQSEEIERLRKQVEEWKDRYNKLWSESRRREGPFSQMLAMARIQIASGVLHIPGWESERVFQGRLRGHGGHVALLNEDGTPRNRGYLSSESKLDWELERGPAMGRPSTVEECLLLVIKVYANQQACRHQEMQPTGRGRQVPMGSFTAQEEQCERCGWTRMDD